MCDHHVLKRCVIRIFFEGEIHGDLRTSWVRQVRPLIRLFKPSWRIPRRCLSVFDQPAFSGIGQSHKSDTPTHGHGVLRIFKTFFSPYRPLQKLGALGLMWLRKNVEREAPEKEGDGLLDQCWASPILASRYPGLNWSGGPATNCVAISRSISRWEPKNYG